MDADRLQYSISKGLSVAARKCGRLYGVYRPRGAILPVAPHQLVARTYAIFTAGAAGADGLAAYAQAIWRGEYDTTGTQPGDYFVGTEDSYFVAFQKPCAPARCVQTNRQVSIVRPTAAMQGGYSGFFSSPGASVIDGWPASVLQSGNHADARVGETKFGGWVLLLPQLPAPIQVADVVNDDLGNVYVVGSAEESAFGWRVLMRQLVA